MSDAIAEYAHVFALSTDPARREATRISAVYLGAIIIITCAVCIVPIELFMVEIWPRHGFASLLLFVVPLLAGLLIAAALPERYYRIKRFESDGRVYEWVGIKLFKRLVPNGDYVNRFIRQSDSSYRVVRDRRSVKEYAAVTRLAERCHLASLVAAAPCAVYAAMLGWDGFVLLLVMPNIPFHLYPVLLQRYTRARIQRVVDRG